MPANEFCGVICDILNDRHRVCSYLEIKSIDESRDNPSLRLCNELHRDVLACLLASEMDSDFTCRGRPIIKQH